MLQVEHTTLPRRRCLCRSKGSSWWSSRSITSPATRSRCYRFMRIRSAAKLSGPVAQTVSLHAACCILCSVHVACCVLRAACCMLRAACLYSVHGAGDFRTRCTLFVAFCRVYLVHVVHCMLYYANAVACCCCCVLHRLQLGTLQGNQNVFLYNETVFLLSLRAAIATARERQHAIDKTTCNLRRTPCMRHTAATCRAFLSGGAVHMAIWPESRGAAVAWVVTEHRCAMALRAVTLPKA